MKRLRGIAIRLLLAVALLAPLSATALAQAGDSAPRAGLSAAQDDARKAELQERFKARDRELDAHKKAGRVGETTEGLVEAVKREYLQDEKLARLIEEENRDRRELYNIIAEETGATPEVVAEQNARRNYQRARPGEYLKTASGEWRQKK